MKNEPKYTLNDILTVVQKLPEVEKDFMLKRVSISDILRVYNDRNEYCSLVKSIDDGMEEWKLWKSSVDSLYKELNKYDADTVHKYANMKVAPEMDGYTIARMVNVVAEVTQRSLSACCKSVSAIISRLYLIKESSNNDFKEESEDDIEKAAYILKGNGINLDKKVFWILSEIHKKWNEFSLVQQTAIAKAVADVRNMENLIVLMENWERIDDSIPSSDIKAIISEFESIIGKTMTSRSVTGLVQAMIDVNESISEREDKKNIDISDDANAWLKRELTAEEKDKIIKDSLILSGEPNINAVESAKYLENAYNEYKKNDESIINPKL